MNNQNFKLCEQLTNKSYINLAQDSFHSMENILKQLLSQRSLPQDGLDDFTIEFFLYNLALMDTNNFQNKVGVGERESRIYSKIVQKRNFNMGHGIGRSGDVSALQPKAVGSSLILKLANYMVLDSLKLMGYQFAQKCLLLPLATGMCLTIIFLYLKQLKADAKYVIQMRIDQKTCIKCIQTANLVPIIIENITVNDEIQSNLELLEAKIQELGTENILCIFSTTSCFAARVPDKIIQIGGICKKYNLYHLCNNAYGLQCSKIAYNINQTMKHEKLDLVVQSMDKNFMVPVGGSIIFSQNKNLIQGISNLYPGRANGAPIQDILITLLSMGKNGLNQLLSDRKLNYQYAKEELQKFCLKENWELLELPANSISLGLYMKPFKDINEHDMTFLGSILYTKRVMGSRILTNTPEQNVYSLMIKNFGSHINDYHKLPYMTVAIAIGMQKKEIDMLIIKLSESLIEFKKFLNNKLK